MMNNVNNNHNGNTGGNDGELADGIPTHTGGFAMTDEENSDNDAAIPASNYNNNDIDAVLAEGKPDEGANIVADEESRISTDDDFDNGNDVDVDEISENAANNENGAYKPQLEDMVNQSIKQKKDKKNSALKRNDSVNDRIYLVEQIERQRAKEDANKNNNNNNDNTEFFGNALKQGINDENFHFDDIVEEMEMDRRKSNAQ